MTHYLHQLNTNAHAFELWDGIFSIGSGKLDDITIVGLEDSQISFVYVDGFVSVQKSLTPLWLDGKLVDTYPCEVAENQVLSLSKDCHLVFNQLKVTGAVAIPDLQVAVGAKETKKVPLLDFLKHYNAVIVGMIFSILAVIFLVFLGDRLEKVSSTVTPVEQPFHQLSQSDIEKYAQSVIGESLIEIRVEGNHYFIRAVQESPAQNLRWKEDLERILNATPGDIQIDLDILPVSDLVFHVKQEVQSLDSIQSLQITNNHRTVTVRGIVRSASATKVSLENIQKKYPYFQIKPDLHEVNINFDILSLTVSSNNATATIKRDGEIAIIPEGGKVFNLGTLKLIKHNGIVVATSHGDLFVPWKKA